MLSKCFVIKKRNNNLILIKIKILENNLTVSDFLFFVYSKCLFLIPETEFTFMPLSSSVKTNTSIYSRQICVLFSFAVVINKVKQLLNREKKKQVIFTYSNEASNNFFLNNQ